MRKTPYEYEFTGGSPIADLPEQDTAMGGGREETVEECVAGLQEEVRKLRQRIAELEYRKG